MAQAAAEQHADEEIELLARRPEKRILFLIVTADRGLAGAFNSNVIRSAQKFIMEHRDAEIHLELIGRKGREFFKRRHSKISGEYTTLFQKAPRYEDALEIARKVIEMFQKAEIDAVYLVGNTFKSMMTSLLVTTPGPNGTTIQTLNGGTGAAKSVPEIGSTACSSTYACPVSTVSSSRRVHMRAASRVLPRGCAHCTTWE